MSKKKILAMVIAGGEGSRLHPLTAERSKPSVPFGARYRIVDFVLSNLVNSGIHAIYLLVQYKSQSLIEHVRKAWVLPPLLQEHFITVVPPQMRRGQEWFQGTADAVYQNINLIRQHSPDLVLVFGADHIYRMDIQQMVDFHLEKGCRRHRRGIAGAAATGLRLRHHRRRRERPHPRLPGKTGQPAGHADSPQPCLRFDGQLPVRHAGAA
jgi:ADP-glucose pyrophosphorylase